MLRCSVLVAWDGRKSVALTQPISGSCSLTAICAGDTRREYAFCEADGAVASAVKHETILAIACQAKQGCGLRSSVALGFAAVLSVHTGRADSPEGPAALDDDAPATELLASDPSCRASRPPMAAGPSRGDRIMSSDRSTRSCRRRHSRGQAKGQDENHDQAYCNDGVKS